MGFHQPPFLLHCCFRLYSRYWHCFHPLLECTNKTLWMWIKEMLQVFRKCMHLIVPVLFWVTQFIYISILTSWFASSIILSLLLLCSGFLCLISDSAWLKWWISLDLPFFFTSVSVNTLIINFCTCFNVPKKKLQAWLSQSLLVFSTYPFVVATFIYIYIILPPVPLVLSSFPSSSVESISSSSSLL